MVLQNSKVQFIMFAVSKVTLVCNHINKFKKCLKSERFTCCAQNYIVNVFIHVVIDTAHQNLPNQFLI